MDKVEVDLEWLLQVRDLLYKLSLDENESGQLAEILGSHLPDYLEKVLNHVHTDLIQSSPVYKEDS